MGDELDRLINATLVPGFAGAEPPAWLDRLIDEGLGGVCLYGDQLVDSGSVPRITGYLRGHRGDLLVALDEEGGDVTRLDYLTGSRYPGNYALGKVDDVALTRSVARAIGADLADAGVNVNYSPSVDVNCDPDNPVIGVRSFGADPARVAAHGAAYVAGLQECGVVACAKHFPGHGATRTDSHLDLPVIDADLGTFHRRELPPFVSAVTAGAKMVMTSHVRFSALDELPATLSRTILTGLLRDDLGYDGVIVTDALDMQAVRRTWGIPGAAVLALAAGADMLCLGSEDGWEHCEAIRSAVRAAIAVGELSVARLEQAEQRVRRLAAWAASPASSRRRRGGCRAGRRATSRPRVRLLRADGARVRGGAAVRDEPGGRRGALEPRRTPGVAGPGLRCGSRDGVRPRSGRRAGAGWHRSARGRGPRRLPAPLAA